MDTIHIYGFDFTIPKEVSRKELTSEFGKSIASLTGDYTFYRMEAVPDEEEIFVATHPDQPGQYIVTDFGEGYLLTVSASDLPSAVRRVMRGDSSVQLYKP